MRSRHTQALLEELAASPADPQRTAELQVALGQHEQAEASLRELPADHWRACRTRAALYRARHDRERHISALHAALCFAPAEEQRALREALALALLKLGRVRQAIAARTGRTIDLDYR